MNSRETLISLLKEIKLARVTSLVCLGVVVVSLFTKSAVDVGVVVILSLSLVVNLLSPWIPSHSDKLNLKVKDLENQIVIFRTELSKLNLVFGVSRGETFAPRREERV